MYVCMYVYLCTAQELKKNNARVVVRCCDPSYDIDPLREEGISVLVSSVVILCHVMYVEDAVLSNM